MKILQISSAQTFGGGERNLVDLTAGLQRRGHEIRVVVRPNSALLQRFSYLPEANIHLLPLRNALDVQSANAVSRLVKRHNIEIIHAHMGRDYSLAAYAARRNPGSRFIVTRHVLFSLKRLHSRVLAGASRVIAVSEAVAEQLCRLNLVPADKVTVVHNGVNVSQLQELKTRMGCSELLRSWEFPDDSVIVGTVGELNALKGHDLFLKAASQVSEKFSRARFIIVGGDHSPKKETKAALRKLISELHLEDRVRLLGEVVDVAPVLACMDIFVSASQTESFGLAIVEAMASGVPVIATATEGAKELIRDGETGVIVPLGHVDNMAKQILELVNDPALRNTMAGKASQVAAGQFDVEGMIDAVEQIYRVSLESQ